MPLGKKQPLSSDLDIINNLQLNDSSRKKAEDLLFTRYAYFIGQAMQRYSLEEEEAFNIYSDTILSAIPKISDGSFEGRSSLKTWLFQIFHNKCVDVIRKKTTNKSSVHKTIVLPDVLMQVADSSKSILQRLMDKTDMDLVKQKLNELNVNCRKLLWQWAEGYSDKEIAVSLDYKTSDVVKTSRLRCLEKLKQLYKLTKK